MVTKTLFSQYSQMKNTLRTDKDMRESFRVAFQYFDRAIHSEAFYRCFPNEEEAKELIEDIELSDDDASSKRDIKKSTYRTKRTRFSERVTSIFGYDPLHILIKGDSEKLPRLTLSCLILINDDLVGNELTRVVSGYKNYFMNDLSFIEKETRKYDFEISDCQKEIAFLRRYSLKRMLVDAGKVDIDKVLFLLSIADYGTPFEKAALLEKYIGQLSNQFGVFASIVQESEKLSTKDSNMLKEQVGVSVKDSELFARIDELEKDNQQKDALIAKQDATIKDMKNRFQSDLNKRVEQVLQEKSLEQKEKDNLKLFDDIDGFGKQQL